MFGNCIKNLVLLIVSNSFCIFFPPRNYSVTFLHEKMFSGLTIAPDCISLAQFSVEIKALFKQAKRAITCLFYLVVSVSIASL